MRKTWKPTVAAVLIWIAVLVSGVTLKVASEIGIPPLLSIFILMGLPTIGGLGALKRKWWNLTLVGSICSILSMPLLGIPAVILLTSAKREFYPR